MLKKVLVMLLAGGQGERLYPLTKDRAKPAVPFGGIYRIIDFTLSNCVNSGLRKICVLTQYKSYSLDRHLRIGWNIFNNELGEFIENIPPQKRISDMWYQGTADAVYQNIYVLERERPEKVLILAGDHIYKMDYRELIEFHDEKKADITVPCIEVPIKDASRFGVIGIDNNQMIVAFDEKPANPKPTPSNPEMVLVSMGIYLFNTEVLVKSVIVDAKKDTVHDFGRSIIPSLINKDRVFAFMFNDKNNKTIKYWRDIGTLDAYWEANMDLVQIDPIFNLYDRGWPIRTYHEQLPPAKTVFSESFPGGRCGRVLNSLVSNGCIISGAHVERSVLSPDVRIDNYSEICDSILMEGVNIGKNVKIRKAIIDKSVSIPDGKSIGYNLEEDAKQLAVTEKGIVIAHKEMHLL
ncbi:MAG: glucose-1-phosphate adenylyltransferase [Planctomycetes bacterium RIFOXYD2_FULL_41_16]|nr:MAG: glucose-1-phosphate adenylyltransferase [Planctomycetes bacterium GWB2_41_19]OHB45453.1 MAG: glucose-1-phosphate adenylyltransferase [Planctomycetes bacterium GWE2_41_14]OHC06757.1 MAG: glucose-1-phosphate adenylyltransferase [Planctomycetes bacterium RIFOXYC2_FULL_41_27]OHC07505.1 MAG: glucose-1-phosphate adenylyltransferase [Planctomycetes bacterium RIFOXYD2_FULL_41_16]